MRVTPIGPEALATRTLSSAVDFAVARKGLDQAKAQGDAAVSLIKAAAEVGRSERGRISRGPTPSETGSRLDVTA